MLNTVAEAAFFIQRKLSDAAARSSQIQFKGQFIGVCKIEWVGISRDTTSSFPSLSIRLVCGLGIKGDKRCGRSFKDWMVDALFGFMTPKHAVALNLCQVVLVATEDDEFVDLFDPLVPGEVTPPGMQCENIRTRGLDLVHVPISATLYLIGPNERISPASLYVTGTRGNTLSLIVRSSDKKGNEIAPGWFIAAFFDEV